MANCTFVTTCRGVNNSRLYFVSRVVHSVCLTVWLRLSLCWHRQAVGQLTVDQSEKGKSFMSVCQNMKAASAIESAICPGVTQNEVHGTSRPLMWCWNVKFSRTETTGERFWKDHYTCSSLFQKDVCHSAETRDKHNGHFLGVLEVTACYDSILKGHLEKVRLSQEDSKFMSSYLSPQSQKAACSGGWGRGPWA